MKEASFLRYVVASSPEGAIRNAQAKTLSFSGRDDAEERISESERLFPRPEFSVYEVRLEAKELEPAIPELPDIIDGEGY